LDLLRNSSLDKACTLQEIDGAADVIRDQACTLAGFFHSERRRKRRRTTMLRTERAYAKLTSGERSYIGEFGKSQAQLTTFEDGFCPDCCVHHFGMPSEFQPFRHQPNCPRKKKKIQPVMLVGTWNATRSRIKGHSRRGGKKLRRQHRRHAPVGMTNEYRT